MDNGARTSRGVSVALHVVVALAGESAHATTPRRKTAAYLVKGIRFKTKLAIIPLALVLYYKPLRKRMS